MPSITFSTDVDSSSEKVLLKYDENVMSIESFRAGIERGASILAYRDENFLPLRELGDDLLITENGRFVPLQRSTNPDYSDVKSYVFGG